MLKNSAVWCRSGDTLCQQIFSGKSGFFPHVRGGILHHHRRGNTGGFAAGEQKLSFDNLVRTTFRYGQFLQTVAVGCIIETAVDECQQQRILMQTLFLLFILAQQRTGQAIGRGGVGIFICCHGGKHFSSSLRLIFLYQSSDKAQPVGCVSSAEVLRRAFLPLCQGAVLSMAEQVAYNFPGKLAFRGGFGFVQQHADSFFLLHCLAVNIGVCHGTADFGGGQQYVAQLILVCTAGQVHLRL